jgi:hypothetical protein
MVTIIQCFVRRARCAALAACFLAALPVMSRAADVFPLSETEWAELLRRYPILSVVIEDIRKQEALRIVREDSPEIHCTTGWASSQRNRDQAKEVRSLPRARLGNNPPIESAHFTVNYVNQDGKPVVTRSIAEAASADFESSFTNYLATYAIEIVPSEKRCDVFLQEGNISNHTTFEDAGNVFLSARDFGAYETNGFVRKLMVYHQAFHLLQYRAKIPVDNRANLWFNEGTAIWAEMTYGSAGLEHPAITGAWKLTKLWNQPLPVPVTSEFNREYALPLMIYMETYFGMEGGLIESVLKQFKDTSGRNDKNAIPKLIEKLTSKSFDEILVIFGARLALKLWNKSADGSKTVEVYDGTVPGSPAIVPPDLNLAGYDVPDRTSQGANFTSEATFGESSILIHKVTYALSSLFDPEKMWSAQVSMDALSSVQPAHYAVVLAGDTTSTIVETTVPKTFNYPTQNAPTPIVVYIINASDYSDSLRYKVTGGFVAP